MGDDTVRLRHPLLSHDGALRFVEGSVERVDGRLPAQRPSDDSAYRTPKWTQEAFDALGDEDKAIHLACAEPGFCFAEDGVLPGARCGPCERWRADPEEYLRDMQVNNDRLERMYREKGKLAADPPNHRG